jgi:hypothetical protein
MHVCRRLLDPTNTLRALSGLTNSRSGTTGRRRTTRTFTRTRRAGPLPTERGRRRPRVRRTDPAGRFGGPKASPPSRTEYTVSEIQSPGLDSSISRCHCLLSFDVEWNTVTSPWSLPACLLHCCIVLVQQSAAVPALPTGHSDSVRSIVQASTLTAHTTHCPFPAAVLVLTIHKGLV